VVGVGTGEEVSRTEVHGEGGLFGFSGGRVGEEEGGGVVVVEGRGGAD